MCEYFSCLAIQRADGSVDLLFSEDDSHHTIIGRAGLRDRNPYLAQFVKLEVLEGPYGPYVSVDQDNTPIWWDDQHRTIRERAIELYQRVDPHHRVLAALDERNNQRFSSYRADNIEHYREMAQPIVMRYHILREQLQAMTTDFNSPRFRRLSQYIYDRKHREMEPHRDARNAQSRIIWERELARRSMILSAYIQRLKSIPGYLPAAS